jgi:hypothetical protein
MTFTWTPPDPLNNTAKTRSIYMTELQVAANVRRVEIAQSQLTFINQNIGQRFALNAIEELKTVVNQLAIDFGYTLGVEDPSLLGRAYVAITKKYGKTACHYPILNDLRQVLNLLEIQGYLIWSQTKYTGVWDKTKYFKTQLYDGSGMPILGTSDEKPWDTHDSFGYLGVDDTYLYAIGTSPQVIKMRLNDYSIVSSGNFSPSTTIYDATLDSNYIWAIGNSAIVYKIDKNSFNVLGSYDLKTVVSYYLNYSRGIVCDKDYLYLTGGQILQHIHPRNIYRGVIVKLKKDFSTCEYNSFSFDYYGYVRDEIKVDMFKPALDDSYLYVKYDEEGQNFYSPINYYKYTSLLKIDKNTLTGLLVKIGFDSTNIVCAEDYLYSRGFADGLDYPYNAIVYDKNGILVHSTCIDTTFNDTNCSPASRFEYLLSK